MSLLQRASDDFCFQGRIAHDWGRHAEAYAYFHDRFHLYYFTDTGISASPHDEMNRRLPAVIAGRPTAKVPLRRHDTLLSAFHAANYIKYFLSFDLRINTSRSRGMIF